MLNVALCVCTCKRPVGLERLLKAVAELDFFGQLSVVVVDNDAGVSEGLSVCERIAPSYRWPLSFALEERRGISFARNRAVALALEQNPDFIAMLDDDERPGREWLAELLRVQSKTDADIVGGPVFPELPPNTPAWLIEGRFFEKGTECLDGAQVRLHSTRNFMGRHQCFRTLGPAPFARDFALSGGEDVIFFGQLAARGFTMYWAAGARVGETIPPSRANLRWLLQRALRRGLNEVKRQRLYERGFANELASIHLTARILAFSLLMTRSALRAAAPRAQMAMILCRALGRMAGHFGVRYSEYRTIHGR